MALPNSGPISLSMIQGEFGGSQPISLSEYYKNGPYVNQYSTAPRVPTAGTIKFSDFYGASHYTPTFQTVVLGDGQTFTVPATIVSSLYVNLISGAGGAGGNDSNPGYPGYPGRLVTGYIIVSPGDVILASVGGAGVGGGSGGGAAGGTGGYGGVLGFPGGRGGNSGVIPWSGAGGGGGGATAIAKNGAIVGVAGGGPGGGGGGNYSSGQPTQGYVSTGSFAGGPGQNKGSGAWYATGREADSWCDFIATYGIWQGDPQSAGPYTYSAPVSFPVSGNYTFNLSIDNYGSLSLDSATILTTNSFSTVTSTTYYVTAGVHTVNVTGTNTGGPAAIAAQIIAPDSGELWNTLSAVSGGGPQDGGGSGAGGGGYFGGAGGALTGGDNGAYSGSYGADLVPPAGSASTSYSGPTVILQGTW